MRDEYVRAADLSDGFTARPFPILPVASIVLGGFLVLIAALAAW